MGRKRCGDCDATGYLPFGQYVDVDGVRSSRCPQCDGKGYVEESVNQIVAMPREEALNGLAVSVGVLLETLHTLQAEQGDNERFVRKLKMHLSLIREEYRMLVEQGHVVFDDPIREPPGMQG